MTYTLTCEQSVDLVERCEQKHPGLIAHLTEVLPDFLLMLMNTFVWIVRCFIMLLVLKDDAIICKSPFCIICSLVQQHTLGLHQIVMSRIPDTSIGTDASKSLSVCEPLFNNSNTKTSSITVRAYGLHFQRMFQTLVSFSANLAIAISHNTILRWQRVYPISIMLANMSCEKCCCENLNVFQGECLMPKYTKSAFKFLSDYFKATMRSLFFF